MPVEQGLPWHPVATGLAGQAIPFIVAASHAPALPSPPFWFSVPAIPVAPPPPPQATAIRRIVSHGPAQRTVPQGLRRSGGTHLVSGPHGAPGVQAMCVDGDSVVGVPQELAVEGVADGGALMPIDLRGSDAGRTGHGAARAHTYADTRTRARV